MTFTDLFVRRPVLALVVSTLILLFGALALSQLPIRQYPLLENPPSPSAPTIPVRRPS